jgi:hypothetical protein
MMSMTVGLEARVRKADRSSSISSGSNSNEAHEIGFLAGQKEQYGDLNRPGSPHGWISGSMIATIPVGEPFPIPMSGSSPHFSSGFVARRLRGSGGRACEGLVVTSHNRPPNS